MKSLFFLVSITLASVTNAAANAQEKACDINWSTRLQAHQITIDDKVAKTVLGYPLARTTMNTMIDAGECVAKSAPDTCEIVRVRPAGPGDSLYYRIIKGNANYKTYERYQREAAQVQFNQLVADGVCSDSGNTKVNTPKCDLMINDGSLPSIVFNVGLKGGFQLDADYGGWGPHISFTTVNSAIEHFEMYVSSGACVTSQP